VNDPKPRLQISVDPADDARLVLVGEIDAHTAPDLAAHLDPLPGDNGDVVIDVAGIDFIDSSGLRLIVEAHQRAESTSRRLVVHQPSTTVTRLFEISGLTSHLTVTTE
jgi:anti-sigma B factor antagonist